MPNPSITTGYAGEVLESLLTLATTGNEIVKGGHIYVKSGIQKSFTIPRMTVDSLIQDRIATPNSSQGTFTITERKLVPADFMVYTEFNPREFESFWKAFQPSGNLVFRELPANVQVEMMAEVLKSVNSYMGTAILQGDVDDGTAPYNKFDGIITKALADADVIDIATPVALTKANIIDKLRLTLASVPRAIKNDPALKVFVSPTTRELYRDAIHDTQYKGGFVESDSVNKFLGKPVVELVGMPDDCIFITKGAANRSSNLWLGVDYATDGETLQVERLQANSELFFFKMLMKADTQIAWGQEAVLYKV